MPAVTPKCLIQSTLFLFSSVNSSQFPTSNSQCLRFQAYSSNYDSGIKSSRISQSQ
eukprot:bmy_13670T0